MGPTPASTASTTTVAENPINASVPSGTFVITGANGGLGSAVVELIVSSSEFSSMHGIYMVREVDAATALNASLNHAKQGHRYDVVGLDLSKLAGVRDVAKKINERVAGGSLPPIRALVLNAAFQCNYLAHWLLTMVLLQSMDREHGRIVVISSAGHDPNDTRHAGMGIFKEERWRTIRDDTTGAAGMRRYSAAKLCLVMMIYELQRRLSSDPVLSSICVLGLDPGAMSKEILRRGNFLMSVFVTRIFLPFAAMVSSKLAPEGFFRITRKSAKHVLRVALDTETLGEHPQAVYLNGTKRWESSAESRDEKKQMMLWQDSVKYTKLKASETVLSSWN
ncbi:putative short-chain dehydrogenase [Cercophora newfieldiana]|uniref:3beta-hydroxysteroid 3-dehydrogenase n=1 Tax=Cercophora newfieldiana TaxID=92897 RepID=A0AA39YAV4_9PEZI|nr:putative short-chain dehydrogenase [Cercophora newfieldiana]